MIEETIGARKICEHHDNDRIDFSKSENQNFQNFEHFDRIIVLWVQSSNLADVRQLKLVCAACIASKFRLRCAILIINGGGNRGESHRDTQTM